MSNSSKIIFFLKKIAWKIKNAVKSFAAKFRFSAKKKNGAGINATKDSSQKQYRLDKKLVSSLKKNRFPKIRKIKYLPKILTAKEKMTILFLFLLAITSTIILAGRYYYLNLQTAPIAGGEYTEALVGAPNFINPLLAQANDVDLDISALIFSGLLKYDKNMNLVKDLALDYFASEDGKIYTFQIRQDAFWHDNQKVTADDVIFTYQSAKNANFKSPLLISLRGIDIEKTGEFEIIFKLSEPFPSFLELLTTGILPEHIWGEIDPINANLTEYNIKPVGSGPWKFKSLIKDRLGNVKSYTIEPNNYYYDKKPYLEKITFKFYPDFVSALNALNTKSVEGINYLPKKLKKQLNNARSKVYSFYLPQYSAVFFNHDNNEFLKQKQIRIALAQSIDKTQILTQALNLEGEIIDGPVLPGFIGYSAEAEKIAYNPSEAAKILEEAGWAKITPDQYLDFQKQIQASGAEEEQATSTATSTDILEKNESQSDPEESQEYYRKKGNDILKITLTTVNFPENAKTAELIKDFWEKIGVKVNLQIIPANRISREIIKPRNYQALLYGMVIGSDPDPYPFWHSSQSHDPGLNLAIFSNRNADKLLEEARQTGDLEIKEEKYLEFQKIIASELPAIFLYSPTYSYAIDQKIKGLDIERILLPKDRFNNLEEWFIKTGRRKVKI